MRYDPLAVLDTGGELPPVLFIHGMTFSKETWAPIVERLRGRFRCVAVDLPGHGSSSGSGADLDAVVARIHATVRATGVRRPVVVGHSAGALHALGYAANHETAGVVDIDQPLFVTPFLITIQQLSSKLHGPDFAAAFEPFTTGIGVGRLPEPERARVLGTQRVDQQLVLDHWHKPLTDSPADLQAEIDALLDRVSVPYLWLAAEPVTEPAREHLLAHIAHAEIEVWPDLGHMLHLASPDRFAARLERFASPRRDPVRVRARPSRSRGG